MTDERDPHLVALFAESAKPVPDDGFTARVNRAIRLRRRLRVAASVVVALSCGIAVSAIFGPAIAKLIAPTPDLMGVALITLGIAAVGLSVVRT